MAEMPSDLRKSNLVSEHQHVYEPKGGFVWWAECREFIGLGTLEVNICGHKFNRGNGVVVGSRRTIEQAIA